MLSANFKLTGFYSWFSGFFIAFYLVHFPHFLLGEQCLPVHDYLSDHVCYGQKLCDAGHCEDDVSEFQKEPDASHFWTDDCPHDCGGGVCVCAGCGDVNVDHLVWVLSPLAFLLPF